jgi:hypothetical protein
VSRWQLLRQFWQGGGKDALLTGTGVFVIILEAFSSKPNGYVLGAGLALTVPSTWDHIKALVPGGGESSSSSSLEHGQRPSPPSRQEGSGGTGE